MSMPKDPVILLSFVNTQLRDNYESLESLCEDRDLDEQEIREILGKINYRYDENSNQFK